MSLKMLMFVYNGVPFFNQVLDPMLEIKVDLTSGFLSAIDSFAGQSFGDSVSAIDLGSQRITSLRVPLDSEESQVGHYFNIICYADRSVSDKKVASFLENIRQKFFKIYSSSDVLDWDGNTLSFLPFKKITSKILHVGEDETPEMDESGLAEKEGAAASVVDGYAILLCDESLQVLKSDLIRVENVPLEEILMKIAGDLGTASTNNWEGILPLLEQRQLAYMVAKKIDTPDGPRFLLICYFIGDKYQGHLTKLISIIGEKFSEILANYGNENTLDLEDAFRNIRADLETFSPMDTIRSAAEVKIEEFRCLGFKNIDQAIHGLIIGTPIAIMGEDREATRRYADELLNFTPHRAMRILEFPPKPVPVNKTDIVHISPNEEKKYPGFIIIDPRKKVVKNGVSNKYCEKIARELQNMPDITLCGTYLKRTINWLLSKATQVRKLSWGHIEPNEINDIRGDLDPDAEKLVLELAEGHNSRIQNLVDRLGKHLPIDKLILDQNFIKFNDKKVLVAMQLSGEQTRAYLDHLVQIGNTLLGPRMVQALLQ